MWVQERFSNAQRGKSILPGWNLFAHTAAIICTRKDLKRPKNFKKKPKKRKMEKEEKKEVTHRTNTLTVGRKRCG